MSNNSILLKIENQVAFITLNRPEVFNSFNREMALEMQETLSFYSILVVCYLLKVNNKIHKVNNMRGE